MMDAGARFIVLSFLYVLVNVIKIYSYVIIADALMSWFLPTNNMLRIIASRLSAPVVGPFRMLLSRLIPPGRGMMIDLSPALACVALQLIAGGLNSLMFYLVNIL